MKYTDPERKPYPFCPGCSHGLVLDAIDTALEKAGADPKRTVLVSDIGCVGMADKYFKVHTFHGLHGRSFTYACGIKLANPELNVFVVVGDGGCGIGGHHLINAARRNIGIKVVCFDNFNFGMTGGEHSVTTPSGGKTNTTPSGNIEKPFDLCNLALASNATFVARRLAFDKELSDTLAEAFRHEGFAFIDVLELCTAYYMPLNEFKKSDLERLIETSGMKMGTLKSQEAPEYSAALRLAWPESRCEPPPPKAIQKKFEPLLKEGALSIMLAGSAGMKIVSAATSLARAGLVSGLFASQEDDYPVTVQTGHSISIVKLSPEEIHYPGVERPDVLVVVSNDGLRVVRKVFDKLTEENLVIIASDISAPVTRARVSRIDFTGISKTNIMTSAITLLLHMAKIMPSEAFRSVLEEIPKEKIRQENVKAFEAGARLAEKEKSWPHSIAQTII